MSGSVSGSVSAADAPGWAGTAMRWLGWITGVVEVGVAWSLATLAGGLLLGWAPASVAASRVLGGLFGPEPSARPFLDVWRGWRAELGRANRVCWPVSVITVLLAADLVAVAAAPRPYGSIGLALLGLIGCWLLLATGHLLSLLSARDTAEVPAARLWRAAAALPLLAPLRSIGCLAALAGAVLLAGWVPALAVLTLPAALLLINARLGSPVLRRLR